MRPMMLSLLMVVFVTIPAAHGALRNHDPEPAVSAGLQTFQRQMSHSTNRLERARTFAEFRHFVASSRDAVDRDEALLRVDPDRYRRIYMSLTRLEILTHVVNESQASRGACASWMRYIQEASSPAAAGARELPFETQFVLSMVEGLCASSR